MRHFAMGAGLLLLAAGVGGAEQGLRLDDVRDGKGRITTIQPIDKSTAAPKEGEAPAAATLEAMNWKCGRCFTDEHKRRWCLVAGYPLSEKPPRVAGWLIKTAVGTQFFVTDSGRVYQRVE